MALARGGGVERPALCSTQKEQVPDSFHKTEVAENMLVAAAPGTAASVQFQ